MFHQFIRTQAARFTLAKQAEGKGAHEKKEEKNIRHRCNHQRYLADADFASILADAVRKRCLLTVAAGLAEYLLWRPIGL